MNCLDCRTEKICTVYKALRDANVVADILHCPYYVSCDTATQKNEPPVVEKRQRPIEEVMNMASKIREISALKQGEKENSSKSACGICGKEDATDTCSQCGRHVCADCVIEDIASHSTYCEECYNKLPASSLGA